MSSVLKDTEQHINKISIETESLYDGEMNENNKSFIALLRVLRL